MDTQKSSRISQFYKRSPEERLIVLREWLGSPHDAELPVSNALSFDLANSMIENVIGTGSLDRKDLD